MAEVLNDHDWRLIGQWVRDELARRREARKGRDALWKEVDRQISMTPVPREVQSGEDRDWFPNTELPFQANALEVIAADARRLKFPRGSEWFTVSAERSAEYEERWRKRRSTHALIVRGGTPEPIELDQETADVLVKVILDHFHRLYDFRGQIELFDAECIKYGSAVLRVRPAKFDAFGGEFRGPRGRITGPAVVTVPIKSVYLDDSPWAILHEGMVVAPAIIRTKQQSLEALKRAASTGGPERGWMSNQLRRLESKDRTVELIEIEGDVLVAKSRGSIYLPNVIITVLADRNHTRPVRFQENPVPFNSYIAGHYMRESAEDPYGSSPIMKGQPIQEAATLAFNSLLAAGKLNAEPSLMYDRFDANLAAKGGPQIFPNSKNAVDSPNAVEVLQIGDVTALLNAYLAFVKQYEDLTGVNDPRRGAAIVSHTTKGAQELEASRGLARTDDFVVGQEQGPLTTMLYKEHEIIRQFVTGAIPVPVNQGGIQGWLDLSGQDLAERVFFQVQGSAGVLDERERAENFAAAVQFAIQIAAVAMQAQQPVTLKFDEIISEAFVRAGINNPSRFTGAPAGVSGAPALGPVVPGTGAQLPGLVTAPLASARAA